MTRFYAPVYMALQELGVGYLDARAMDISVAATYLGMSSSRSESPVAAPAPPPPVEFSEEETPNWVDEEGNPAPASSAHGIRPPKFWRGDNAAFQSMTAAEVEMANEHRRRTERD